MEMKITEPHHNVDTKRCYIHLFSLEAYSDEPMYNWPVRLQEKASARVW